MQQESEPSPSSFGDTEPSTRRGPFARAALAMAARFAGRTTEPLEQPFRDSDFETDSGYFGRPLGDH
jgi:hypothetical protein